MTQTDALLFVFGSPSCPALNINAGRALQKTRVASLPEMFAVFIYDAPVGVSEGASQRRSDKPAS